NPNSLSPAFNLDQYLNTSSQARKSPTGQPYLKGFIPIAVGDATIFGVPVFPEDRPHLVTNSEFEQSRKLPLVTAAQQDAIPPNSFKGRGEARAASAQQFVNAVACAVVGCLDRQYEGRFPLGYVRIHNTDGASVGSGAAPAASDGSNDLFNKELFSPSKLVF